MTERFRSGLPAVFAIALILLLLAGEPAPAEPPRPRVLVTGFEVSGDLLEQDSGAARSLEILSEALLAPRFAAVSSDDLEAACERADGYSYYLLEKPDLRLAVARDLGVAKCVSGWACAFGERIVLIVEVIDPARGLPGTVHRRSCDGLEEIPETLEALLDEALDFKPAAAPPEARAEAVTVPPGDLPGDDLLETWPNDAYRRLSEIRESAVDGHVPPELAAEARRLVPAVREHRKRLQTDPTWKAAYVLRENVAKDPLFHDYEAAVTWRPPYLVFVEERDGVDAAERGVRLARILEELRIEFRKRLVPDMELPPGDAGILRVFVFTRPGSTRAYQQVLRQPVPPGVAAWYSPKTRWLILDASKENERLERSLVHEGFHQLQQAYAKPALETATGEEVLWTDPRMDSESHWLQEGLPELFAEAWVEPGAEWDFGKTGPRLEMIRMLEKRKMGIWRLPELLRAQGNRDIMRKGGYWPAAFFAQAWSFCHFLWYHEDGKYREKLLAAFRRELVGLSGYEEFLAAWGEEAADREAFLENLEKEWEAYVEGL